MEQATIISFSAGVVAVLAGLVGACSGTEASKPSSSAETKRSVDDVEPQPGATGDDETESTDAPDTETACVAKGAKGNAAGVGAYCDEATRCGSGQFCTADFGAPVGAHFCTKICATDADCGEGAFCFEEDRGAGCVPAACKE